MYDLFGQGASARLAAQTLPARQLLRLQQIESGAMTIGFDAPGAQPPR
ncbi:hypothetical protein CTP10_R47460 [Cupriavidus sp. P-10]|nr:MULTISPECIES: hypothetical protein [unclassified Cupriavidus]BDB27341.1 hypothetical protein CTP10_R47460 [Cupriavidus sp. P-10]